MKPGLCRVPTEQEMAHSSRKSALAYPVWVGNLKENITEAVLLDVFRPYGAVVSVKVMGDEKNMSK